MTSHSPPRQQNAFTEDLPVHVKSGHSNHSNHSDLQEDARSALRNLGLSIPVITYQTFLDHLAPPQPDFDLDSTIRSLKLGSEPVLTSSNRWSNFPNSPKDSRCSEDTIFSPIPEIFTKVVVAIIANSGGKLTEDKNTVDFSLNPSRAPTSAERHKRSRPDGYLVLKDRSKVMSKGGRKEDILWGDIVLSWEYRRKGGVNELDDVRIHQVLLYRVLCRLLIPGRTEVLVELSTHHGRRSASSSHIWLDHRKLQDKGVVLLPHLARCQRAIQFYSCASFVV